MKKILLTLCITSCFAFSQDIELESFATGFTNPVNVKHAGDARLFVAERLGIIKIINSDGTVNPTPFININSKVTNNGGEQGLLAIAFHPNYTTNGYFYVNYINNSGDTVISRFTRNTANTADASSELILMTISQPYSNHNGGDMHFGPNDGYLYISTGDGGSGGDPGNRAQNLNSLLGKMLRIDVDNTTVSPALNYAIPSNNPFVSNTSARNEIWAYGLRNPWKFSFDKSNGDMWIGDVGQNSKEEIDLTLASSAGGENYGWRCYEGNSSYNTSGCPASSTMTFPVAEYNLGGTPYKCAITGGYRYRGGQTTLQGLYFFADYCSDEIGIVEETSPNVFQLTINDRFTGNNFSAFAEDLNGELYIVGLNSGVINKIVDANLSVDEEAFSSIKMHPNPTSSELNITSTNISSIKNIKVSDLQGKIVLKHSNFTSNTITLATNTLVKGFYIVEISGLNGEKSIKKLIIN